MSSQSITSNIDTDSDPLIYNHWDADVKSIPEIQQLNNSVHRRDEFEKYAIAAEKEILRLKQVLKIYVDKI